MIVTYRPPYCIEDDRFITPRPEWHEHVSSNRLHRQCVSRKQVSENVANAWQRFPIRAQRGLASGEPNHCRVRYRVIVSPTPMVVTRL